jgi:hypothetical protein
MYHGTTVRNPEARGCSARLSFSVRWFSNNWPETAALVIRDQGGKLLLRDDPGEGEAETTDMRLALPPGTAATRSLALALDARGVLLRPGEYGAEIEVSLWPRSPAKRAPLARQTFKVRFEIEATVRLSLPASAPGTTLSLGALRPGQRADLAVLVTSNAPYSLNVHSKNGWTLRRLEGSGRRDERASYRFFLDGDDAANDRGFAREYQRAQEGTRAHHFEVLTGQFEYLRHGRYQDIITVTMTALH